MPVQAASCEASTDAILRRVHVPRDITPGSATRPVVVAIVDDAVRLSHRDLRAFIWTNPAEVAGNLTDDDGNGHVDDVHGWDVSDGDGSVAPPRRRTADFFHGTHLAGIVTRVVRAAFGDEAPRLVRILPVKALADRAERDYLKDGYRGIEYAAAAGADVILCAWGVGHISASEERVLQSARDAGALIVASAGNFPEDREQFPAAGESVLAVAGLDQDDVKAGRSNYGAFVDLSAPGTRICSASVRSDDGYEQREGTSQAAALVAAAAAIVKVRHPSYSAEQVTACLKQSARSIEPANREHIAKLGAGRLDVEAATRCGLFGEGGVAQSPLVNPQGYLRFGPQDGKAAGWTIRPRGPFEGLRFTTRYVRGQAAESSIRFYADRSPEDVSVKRFRLAELPESVYVPSTVAHVVFEPDPAAQGLDWLLEYRAEPIDFRTLYCRDTVYLDTEGSIEDGSGPNSYSANSDCKWLITAPEGRVVRIRFTELDTEPGIDKVLFFDGAGTHEEIMASFSGRELPPELVTWRNQVLLWFVTDGQQQGSGWRAEYRFEDP